MPRIYTDQPSDGAPINVFVPATVNGGFVSTTWMELVEAPDFSVPSTGALGIVPDANIEGREIRGGETYFETPLTCYNSSNSPRWVQLEMVLPSIGALFETGAFIPAGPGGGASGRVFMCPRASTTARVYDVATDALITPNGSFPSGRFLGAVKMNDNRIYMIPFGFSGTSQARIYNPVTDIFTTPNGTFSLNGGQWIGTLLNDGRVFIVPYADTVARIYDPVADTLTVANGSYVLNAHYAAVTLPSGKVFMPPNMAGRAAVYDPATNTKTEVGPVYGRDAFLGAVLLTSGKVFMVPYREQLGAVYDPAGGGSITPVSAANWGESTPFGYFSGARLPDGRVYMPGFGIAQGRIWDPATDTSSFPSGTFSADGDHRGLIPLADGRIYMIPYNSVAARIYNATTDVLATAGGSFPSTAERIPITGQLQVPAKGTLSIPIQGQRLLCPARPGESQGGKLLARAEVSDAIQVFGQAVEMEAASHAPNTEL
jgi:hypothetical protein